MDTYAGVILKFLRDNNNLSHELLSRERTRLLTDVKVYKNGVLVNENNFDVNFQASSVWGWIQITFYDPIQPDNAYVLNTKYQIFRSDYLEKADYRNNILALYADQDGDKVVVHIQGYLQ